MGTTAEKFNYAFSTKDLLKTEINKINNVLTDESTFRSYPQELFNGYLDVLNNGTDTLWNNLEKVSQTGTEAVLEGVETAPIKMVLNGNTSQETTTGKNLFTGLIKNVRLDPNNGEQFSGSTGASTDFIPVNINSNNSYYLSGLVDTIRSFTCAYNSNKEFLGRTAARTVSEKALTVGSFASGTPTGTGDIAYIRITQYIQGEGTIDIIDGAKIQLEQGSTATSYEPYTGGIPSPNSDYPQEVKVVKGENVVSVQGKQLFDGILELGNINSTTGEKMVNSNYIINTNPIPVEELTNYKISSNGEGIKMYIFEYKEDLSYNLTNRKSVEANAYFTTNSGTRYISFRPVSSITNLQELIQIERGTTATPYVPYSKTDYPINLGNIELCKINTYKDYFHKDSGKWYVHKEIGKKVFDGTETLNKSTNTSADIFSFALENEPSSTETTETKCNYLKYVSSNAVGSCRKYSKNIYLIPYEYGTATINEFKTTLSTLYANGNPYIVYYILATPTEEEITNTTLIEQLEAISKAKSVKDKTYITQTNDELPFILDVEAIKEYEVN